MKLPHKTNTCVKNYTQTDGTEVIITVHIINHQKLKVFVPDCVDNFQGNLCVKSKCGSFFVKALIRIAQSLHDEILDK